MEKNHGDGVRFGLNFNTVSLFNIHPTSFLLSQFFRKSAHVLVEPISTFNTSYDVVLSKVVPFVAKKFNVHIFQKFSFRYVSDDDFSRAANTGSRSRKCSFWQAAKTGDRRTGVTFGRQPTQVFGRPCRSTQRVIALRRNF